MGHFYGIDLGRIDHQANAYTNERSIHSTHCYQRLERRRKYHTASLYTLAGVDLTEREREKCFI